MRSPLFIGVGSWTMPALSAEHSCAPQPVQQALQAAVHPVSDSGWVPGFGKYLCFKHTHDRALLRPVERMGRRGTRQTNPPSNISNQIQSVWFYMWMDTKQMELSIRNLWPSWLNFTGNDLWLFVQDLEGSLSMCSPLPLNHFPLHPSALEI